MVNAAYGDQALSCLNVFWWYRQFHDGREDIEDSLFRRVKLSMQCTTKV